jgi:sec-independent protein translocase protein TatA
MNLGPTELIIILVIVLVLFGSTRLPKLARSLGEASKEFKKGVNERDEEAKRPPPDPDEPVTMTRAELDAMLEEREKAARGDDPPPPSPSA